MLNAGGNLEAAGLVYWIIASTTHLLSITIWHLFLLPATSCIQMQPIKTDERLGCQNAPDIIDHIFGDRELCMAEYTDIRIWPSSASCPAPTSTVVSDHPLRFLPKCLKILSTHYLIYACCHTAFSRSGAVGIYGRLQQYFEYLRAASICGQSNSRHSAISLDNDHRHSSKETRPAAAATAKEYGRRTMKEERGEGEEEEGRARRKNTTKNKKTNNNNYKGRQTVHTK